MGRITNLGKNMMLDRMYKSTVTYSVPSQFKIGTGTTSPVPSDTDLQTPITAWNSGSDFKDFDASYPTFNTTNREVETRGTVNTTVANDNTITETGTFNTDGTEAMDGRATFTGVTKNNTTQFIIIWKRRIID